MESWAKILVPFSWPFSRWCKKTRLRCSQIHCVAMLDDVMHDLYPYPDNALCAYILYIPKSDDRWYSRSFPIGYTHLSVYWGDLLGVFVSGVCFEVFFGRYISGCVSSVFRETLCRVEGLFRGMFHGYVLHKDTYKSCTTLEPPKGNINVFDSYYSYNRQLSCQLAKFRGVPLCIAFFAPRQSTVIFTRLVEALDGHAARGAWRGTLHQLQGTLFARQRVAARPKASNHHVELSGQALHGQHFECEHSQLQTIGQCLSWILCLLVSLTHVMVSHSYKPLV